jgi:Ricin-type beta-trefoil lectin domain
MMKRWLIVLAHASLVSACMGDGALEEPDESVVEEELLGVVGNHPPELVAIDRVVRGSIYARRVAFLVRDNLALGWHVARPASGPSSLAFEDHGVVGNVKFINTTMRHSGLAVYQLDRPAGGIDKIDTRTGAALAGVNIACWSPIGQRRFARVEVLGGTATTLDTKSRLAGEIIQANDVGAPCVTTTLPTKLVGFVISANQAAQTAVIARAEAMRAWVAGMTNLARVRDDGRTQGPYSLSTDPAVVGAGPRCMDLPSEDYASGVDVQQYPCNYNLNQLWYLDYSDLSSTRPRVVSTVSGRCLDVEWGDAVPGRALQQYDCHTGANQKFERKGSGNLVPDSGIAANLCMSVNGGPTPAPAWISQQTCLANPNAFQQQWRYDSRPLPAL